MPKLFFNIRSKVSRHIFIAVSLCALLPIAVLIFLTIYNVHNRLNIDTDIRLHQASKNIGMALMAELNSLRTLLEREALLQKQNVDQTNLTQRHQTMSQLDPFKKIWYFSDSISPQKGLPQLEQTQINNLTAGRPHLSIGRENENKTFFLWTHIIDDNNGQAFAAGQINLDYLWDYAQGFLPSQMGLLITDDQLDPLFENNEVRFLSRSKQFERISSSAHTLEIESENEAYLVGRWQLFLMAAFDAPGWNIYVTEPKTSAFAGLFDFQRNAGLIGLSTFWVILLGSSILIRKTLTPLEKLSQATQKISTGNYDLHIDVTSRDEFGHLSQSFNQMANKIQQQIAKQQSMTLAVRDVLGAGEQEEIISRFFTGLSRITSPTAAMLTLYKPELMGNKKIGSTWIAEMRHSVQLDILWATDICPQEIAALNQLSNRSCFQNAMQKFPVLLAPLKKYDCQQHCLYNFSINNKVNGILALAGVQNSTDDQEITTVHQLADQLGVSLSRAEVVSELDALNIGILTALARTVDSNSRWTHGHSERVTEYALIIAETLGLSEDDKQALQQAGLLHDLGKVSVPSEILNKTGKLTTEEYSLMQQHPAEADRIIEPIHVFKSIRPIVRQHHERWDGKGYPDGLHEKNIHPGARILSVADVFDALYSDRPYRQGWPSEKVLDYIREEAGKAFDPQVVAATLKCSHRLIDQADRSNRSMAV